MLATDVLQVLMNGIKDGITGGRIDV